MLSWQAYVQEREINREREGLEREREFVRNEIVRLRRGMAEVLSRWRNRLISMAMRRWQAYVQEILRVRRGMVKVLSRWHYRRISMAIVKWQAYIQEIVRLRRGMLKTVIHRTTAVALCTWQDRATGQRKIQATAMRLVMRTKMLACARALVTWSAGSREAARRRMDIEKVLSRWRNRHILMAIMRWQAHVRELVRSRRMLAKVVGRWTMRTLAVCWEEWKRKIPLRQTVSNIIMRMMHRTTAVALCAWQDCAVKAKAIKSAETKTVWHLARASVRRVWREWRERMASSRKFNRTVRRLRARFAALRLSTLSHALDEWYFGAISLLMRAREEKQFVVAQRAMDLRCAISQHQARDRTLRDSLLILCGWMLHCSAAKRARRAKKEATSEVFFRWRAHGHHGRYVAGICRKLAAQRAFRDWIERVKLPLPTPLPSNDLTCTSFHGISETLTQVSKQLQMARTGTEALVTSSQAILQAILQDMKASALRDMAQDFLDRDLSTLAKNTRECFVKVCQHLEEGTKAAALEQANELLRTETESKRERERTGGRERASAQAYERARRWAIERERDRAGLWQKEGLGEGAKEHVWARDLAFDAKVCGPVTWRMRGGGSGGGGGLFRHRFTLEFLRRQRQIEREIVHEMERRSEGRGGTGGFRLLRGSFVTRLSVWEGRGEGMEAKGRGEEGEREKWERERERREEQREKEYEKERAMWEREREREGERETEKERERERERDRERVSEKEREKEREKDRAEEMEREKAREREKEQWDRERDKERQLWETERQRWESVEVAMLQKWRQEIWDTEHQRRETEQETERERCETEHKQALKALTQEQTDSSSRASPRASAPVHALSHPQQPQQLLPLTSSETRETERGKEGAVGEREWGQGAALDVVEGLESPKKRCILRDTGLQVLEPEFSLFFDIYLYYGRSLYC